MPKERNGKVIKKIKILKKGIAIIFVDGERIDISEEAYTSNYLYVGKELSPQELEKLNLITSVKKLSEYALGLLAQRHYTEWQMRQKLYAKEATKESVDYVINKLKELDLINDKAFIEDYLGYAEEKGYGKHKIIKELSKKGIFAEEIQKIKFSSNIEKKKAMELLPSLERKYDRYSYEQKKRHIFNALVSRGFEIEVANSVVDKISSKNDKEEKEKLKRDYQKAYAKYVKKYQGRELRERLFRSLISKGYSYGDVSIILGGLEDDC